MTLDMDEAATWLAIEATATGAGMPKSTSTGVIRKPPPMPNMPEMKPTTAPRSTISGALTATSAMGR
jgi:hypothetical protein